MKRHLIVFGVIAMLVAASADLGACGDKFLRVGRSARFRRYAAAYPATILIYKPAHATPSGMKEFEALLKRAGHTPIAVESGTNISNVLATGHFDLVIADYADASRLKADLQSVSSKPAILPILYKPSKAVESEAETQYAFLIKPHLMTKYDALAEIDRVMQVKTGPRGSASHP